jgi:hypothetical protein
MSHTLSSHSADSNHLTSFIVCEQSCYEWMYIYKNYISMQNLEYFVLLMGLGDTERPYLAMARMKDSQGGNRVPMAGEVRRHSS